MCPKPDVGELPRALYTAAQVREFDRIAIEDFAIPGARLMERAGSRAYHWMRSRWPGARELLVVCGVGNNAGDGLVLARLAKSAGLGVRVLQLGDPGRLRGDAQAMAEAWRAVGGEIEAYAGLPAGADLVVDAILGTGLEREVDGSWAEAIEALNRYPSPRFSLDIPSGLHADTGRVMGVAVRASACISFIGLKQGLFSGQGPDCCGELTFDTLDVPAEIYSEQPVSSRRVDWSALCGEIGRRRRTAHKGDFGHLLAIGGAAGYSGAIRLAGEAAARCGAGLVTVATHHEHAGFLNLERPELMCRGVEGIEELAPLVQRATILVLGPGLGRESWGEEIYLAAMSSSLPLVVDADALFWLFHHPVRRDNRILTPHPGEAARLLQCGVAEVQADRFAALRELQSRYGGVVALKGAGTLIADASGQPPALCSGGNPGLASGGSGDLLSGIIGALVAQGHGLRKAAELGVCLHAAAGDRAARDGEIGLLAGDLLPELRPLLNRGFVDA